MKLKVYVPAILFLFFSGIEKSVAQSWLWAKSSHYSDGNRFYPNPAKDKLLIKFDDEVLMNVDLRVYNTVGEIVFSEKANKAHEISIDISDLVNAIYYLEVNYNGHRLMKKLLKE